MLGSGISKVPEILLSDFAGKGFSIMTLESREEYLKQIDAMKPWNESPEYLAKHPKRSSNRRFYSMCSA